MSYRKIPDLVQELNRLGEKMENGELSADELRSFTELSRELYERSVVLRYKAFEEAVKGSSEEKPKEETAEDSTKENMVEEEPPAGDEKTEEEEVVPKGGSFKMGGESQKQDYSQISLIDSIHELSDGGQSVNDQIADAPGADTNRLADKLQKSPVADLKKAIPLNQKFQFTKELFEGDENAFKRAIDKLNAADDKGEAQSYLHQELKAEYKWSEESETFQLLTNWVERRYS